MWIQIHLKISNQIRFQPKISIWILKTLNVDPDIKKNTI